MPKSTDLIKTWVPGSSRGSTTFNAPGTLSIPYGRYKATLEGRGGTGGANTAATWNTNYNIAYPIANQPIAAQPAASWNTNYNVAYPIANQPIANQPAATWNTNYNIAYPIANQPIANQPAATWNTNYNIAYPVANQPIATYNEFCQGTWYTRFFTGNFTVFSNEFDFGPYRGCGFFTQFDAWSGGASSFRSFIYSGSNFAPATWNTNYNVAYPVANRPVATWNTNYNTNYNVAYPIANRPVATWNTNYNTNYNVAYPIANQPAATWNTNYNTNYNVAYPIANQPVATFSVGPAGTPITIFGVTMPGAPGGGSTATPISPTPISYYTKPDGTQGEPDNASYPVTVPTGGEIKFTIE